MSRISAEETRLNLKRCVWEGAFATPWVVISLPGGFIMVALLTQYFKIQPALFGVLVSLPAWGNALQIVMIPFLARFLSSRDLFISLSWLNVGLWSMFAAVLPVIPGGGEHEVPTGFLVTFFLLASFSLSFLGVGWLAWIDSWIPSKLRGTYLGKRGRIIQIVTISFLLLSMVVLYERGDSLWPYQVLIILAVVLRGLSNLINHTIINPISDSNRMVRSNWFSEVWELRKHVPYKRFVVFNTYAGFWIGAILPFGPYFAFEFLEVSQAKFAAINIMATLAGAFTMPVWGRYFDKFGTVRLMAWALGLWFVANYLWVIMTPETHWLLFLQWFWGGAMASGFLLGSLNLLFNIAPPHLKTAAISLNLACSSTATAIGSILLGYILEYGVTTGFDEAMSYRIAFAVCSTMVLTSILLLLGIKEPKQRPVDFTMTGAMRMLRQTIQSQGYTVVSNINNHLVRRNRD